jgi:hypothetical protein
LPVAPPSPPTQATAAVAGGDGLPRGITKRLNRNAAVLERGKSLQAAPRIMPHYSASPWPSCRLQKKTQAARQPGYPPSAKHKVFYVTLPLRVFCVRLPGFDAANPFPPCPPRGVQNPCAPRGRDSPFKVGLALAPPLRASPRLPRKWPEAGPFVRFRLRRTGPSAPAVGSPFRRRGAPSSPLSGLRPSPAALNTYNIYL